MIRSMIRYDFSLSLHGVSQFISWAFRLSNLMRREGGRSRSLTDLFLGIHDQLVVSVILFFRFSLRFFVVLIRSLKQAVFF